MVNDGPDCRQIEIAYWPHELTLGATIAKDEHTGLSPRLSYSPDRCKTPDGDPFFESITPALIQVERASGAVTALSTGAARVGVTHGTLHALATLIIKTTPPCDRLGVYGILPLTLRTTVTPRVEYSTSSDSHDPTLCIKPAEPARLVAEDPTILEVDQIGAVKGIAVGSTRLIARATLDGKSVEASTIVTVVDGQPCEQLKAAYAPTSIAVGETAALAANLEPAGCVPPLGELRTYPAWGSVRLNAAGGAVGVLPGYFAISVWQGNLSSLAGQKADLRVLGSCAALTVRAQPDRIRPGEATQLVLLLEPQDCAPLYPGDWTVDYDVLLRHGQSLFSFIAERGGIATVRLTPPRYLGRNLLGTKTVRILIEAPGCERLAITNPPSELKPGERWFPLRLNYTPDGCTWPAGSAVWASDSPRFVVSQRGELRARTVDLPGAAPYATISVKHGRLFDNTIVRLAE